MRSDDGNLEVLFGTDDLVFANHRGCLILDLADPTDVAVVALDARRGTVRWKVDGVLVGGDIESAYEVRDQLQQSAGDVLPVLTVAPGSRELIGLESVTGEVRWRTPASHSELVGLSRDTVVVRLTGEQAPPAIGALRAFDRSTGRALWTRDYRVESFPRAAGSGSTFALLSKLDDEHAQLEVVDAPTGTTRFVRDLPPWFGDGQIGLDGDVALVSGGSELTAIDLATGESRWTITATAGVTAPPVVDATVFTQLDQDGSFAAVDLVSGATRWMFPPAEYRFANLMATANGHVAAGWSAGGRSVLAGFDARTGELRWERPWPSGGLATAGGTDAIYLSGGCALTSRD
jgi:outer membrane protein assembly factor BamB